MKKTILTIMVAAMMLVAFTACEQQMPTYKTPVGMTLQASKTVYLEGEAFDESTLTGVVTYSDGSSDTFTGSQLNYNATSGATNNGVRPLSITAEYGLTGKEVSAQTTVYYYTVAADDITVGNIPTVATSTGTGYKIDLSEVTVTVNVGGETRELVRGTEFTNTDYTDGSGSYTEDTTVEPKGTLTTVSIFGQTGVAVPVPADYEVEVVYEPAAPTAFDQGKTTSISVALADDATVWYDDTATVAQGKFVVTGTDSNGFSGTVTGATIFIVKDGSSVEASTALNTTDTLNVYATLEVGDKTLSASTTVKPEDYINAIKATLPENYTVADFGSLDASKISVKGRLASAATQTGADTEFTVTITSFDVDHTLITSAEDSRTVTVSSTYRIKGTTALTDELTVAAPSN